VKAEVLNPGLIVIPDWLRITSSGWFHVHVVAAAAAVLSYPAGTKADFATAPMT
jgi:hypothetical protein